MLSYLFSMLLTVQNAFSVMYVMSSESIQICHTVLPPVESNKWLSLEFENKTLFLNVFVLFYVCLNGPK